MKTLYGSETKIDSARRRTLEVIHLPYFNILSIDDNLRSKQILRRGTIEKIVLCLLHDVVSIDKEKEIPVTLLIEIQHRGRHDERFARACCHVE